MENETKKLTIPSKAILIILLVLTLIGIGLFIIIFSGSKNKIVATKVVDSSYEKYIITEEHGFENGTPYVIKTATYETEKTAYQEYLLVQTPIMSLKGPIEPNAEVEINGKNVIAKQKDTSEYISVGDTSIDLEKGKKYSKLEQKKLTKKIKQTLESQGFNIK